MSQKIVPRFFGYCGGAVDTIISVFNKLHRSSFNLEFETSFESIRHVVADLWQRKGKTSGCLKNSTPVVLQQCQNKVDIQSKGSGIVLKCSLHFLRGRKCSLMNRQHS